MKTILFSILLLSGSVAFATAQAAIMPQTASMAQVSVEGEYKTVELTDLNQAIQEGVKQLAGDTYTVKGVEFDQANRLARITLVNKADQSEKSLLLNEEGKETTQAAAPEAPAAEVAPVVEPTPAVEATPATEATPTTEATPATK